jgi:hypothetical protein
MWAVADLDPIESMVLDVAPGLVLAPYEALIAQIMWTAEGVKRGDHALFLKEVFGTPPLVAPPLKRRIINAFLLFGPLDAISGLFLLDRWLALRGSRYSSREIVGDLLPTEMFQRSPFAHSLEQGFLGHPMSPPQEKSREVDQVVVRRNLARAARRALNRAGLRVTSEDVEKQLAAGIGPWIRPSNPRIEERHFANLMMSMNQIDWALFATLSSISRSISMSAPYLSMDEAGPAWLAEGFAQPRLQTFRVVLDEIQWLPKPQSLEEAISMAEDDRINDLRNHIAMWSTALSTGELADLADLRKVLREDVKRFQGQRWAGRVERVLAYASVPASIAEAYAGHTGLSLGLAGLGTTAQLISDLDARSKRGSWLSLGRDFILPED